ncbi:MAG: hypothetical protein WC546_05040 [Candidatus Omnitrophota bacterium]
MINRIYVISIFLLLSGNIFPQAQNITLESLQDTVYLPRTELVDQKITDSTDSFIGMYEYRSELSKDEIIKFYSDSFYSQGLMLQPAYDDEGKMFHFARGMIDDALLNVYYTDEENITYYLLDVYRAKYAIAISNYKFTKPKSIDFAPVNYDYTQAVVYESGPQHKFAQYLTDNPIEDVANFYLENMGAYNWTLFSRRDFGGSGNIIEIMAMGFSNPKIKDLPQRVAPGVMATVETIALVFKGNNSNCVVNITQFQDPPEVLKSSRIINPDIIAKYGNVFITVECGYPNELSDAAR